MSHAPARVCRQALVVGIFVLLLVIQNVHADDIGRLCPCDTTPKPTYTAPCNTPQPGQLPPPYHPENNATAPATKNGSSNNINRQPNGSTENTTPSVYGGYNAPSTATTTHGTPSSYPNAPTTVQSAPADTALVDTASSQPNPTAPYNPENTATSPVTNNGSSNNINRQPNGSTQYTPSSRPRLNSTREGGYNAPSIATTTHGTPSSYPKATYHTPTTVQPAPADTALVTDASSQPNPSAPYNPANNETAPVTNKGSSNNINRQFNGSTQYTTPSVYGEYYAPITATNTHGAPSSYPNAPTTVQSAPADTALVDTASSQPNPSAPYNPANKETAPDTNYIYHEFNENTQYTSNSVYDLGLNGGGYYAPITATNTHGALSSYPGETYSSNLSPAPKTSSGDDFISGYILGAIRGAIMGGALTSTQNRTTDDGSSLSGGGGGGKYKNRNDDKIIVINNGSPGSLTTIGCKNGTTVINNGTAQIAPVAPPQTSTAVPTTVRVPGDAPIFTVNGTLSLSSVPLAPLSHSAKSGPQDVHCGAKAVFQWSALSALLTILVAYFLH